MRAKPRVLVLLSVFLCCCGKQSDNAMPLPAAATSSAVSRKVASLETSAAQSPSVVVRRLVKKVELTLAVADTAAVSENLNRLTTEFGGHVGAMSTTRQDSGGALVYEMTLRIPEGRLDEALGRIKKLADRIDRETVSAEDVTDQFVDLNARMKTLVQTEGELQALLAESRQRQQKAEDIMAIYRELTGIRSNIEQIRGQLNVVENLTSLATIGVTLVPTQSPTQVVTSWRPSETVRNSFHSLVSVLTGLVDLGIILLIVVIPPVLLLALAVWLCAKAWRAARVRGKVPAA